MLQVRGLRKSFARNSTTSILTVAENLVVYGRYFGIARRAMLARVPRLLEFAGL